ncbi:acyltransferase [Paenibacillus crassostreae]|uniref:Acyltransferase n=1 Tax=Paenibacillus crassostreae TaxID=1763538 RepID=A0A167GFH5_9BACL|nr:acyltransferase [Paenibacillus crassostreae]OAB77526.1 acyltransferase [Paenibacillus crassostreae]
MSKKEWLPQLDVFRALAILGVLSVHASSYAAGVQALSSPFYYVYNFMNIFFKFGTSSFIFLSGFVLFYTYYERPVTVSLVARFYRRRLTYIIIPYVIASICYFLYSKYIMRELMGVPYVELWVDLRNALLTGTAYTHLYFVAISIQFYILFPFILKLFQWKPWIVKWAIPLALALQWGFVFYNKYSLHLPNKGSLAITYLAYYITGAYLAIHFDRIKPWLMNRWELLTQRQKRWTITLWSSWFVVALLHVQVWYVTRTTGNTIHTQGYELIWNVHAMLSALVLLHATFLIYRKFSRKIVAFLTRMGELSFAIYLLHPMVLAQYRRFRYHIEPDSLGYLAFIIGGLLVTLLVTWAIVQFCFRRISWSWVCLGTVPRSLSPKVKHKHLWRPYKDGKCLSEKYKI